MRPLAKELADLALNLPHEVVDTMSQLTDATNEVIDDLGALERIAVYGRDREVLDEHLANLRALRELRDEFHGTGAATPSASPSRPAQ